MQSSQQGEPGVDHAQTKGGGLLRAEADSHEIALDGLLHGQHVGIVSSCVSRVFLIVEDDKQPLALLRDVTHGLENGQILKGTGRADNKEYHLTARQGFATDSLVFDGRVNARRIKQLIAVPQVRCELAGFRLVGYRSRFFAEQRIEQGAFAGIVHAVQHDFGQIRAEAFVAMLPRLLKCLCQLRGVFPAKRRILRTVFRHKRLQLPERIPNPGLIG